MPYKPIKIGAAITWCALSESRRARSLEMTRWPSRVSTVRYWHANYVEGDGILKADERGHYTRELLVTEEDVKNKLVKWSLKAAKDSELSVLSARAFLNDELLCNLEAATPAQRSNLLTSPCCSSSVPSTAIHRPAH